MPTVGARISVRYWTVTTCPVPSTTPIRSILVRGASLYSVKCNVVRRNNTTLSVHLLLRCYQYQLPARSMSSRRFQVTSIDIMDKF